MSGNREYKSDVFSMLMRDKVNALELYNALNGSCHDDPEAIEMCTLDSGFSLSVRNDASFVLDSNLSVYEHQSTICPNMPVRSLIYFSITISKMLKEQNMFGSTLVKIPTPKFAVFYNGPDNQPEQYDMKLSDAFYNKDGIPQLELTCRVYNINKGRNRELLEKCTFLKGYMTFVDYVRDYYDDYGRDKLELAINRAIDRCISENILKEFFKENRAEVVKVIQLDYTFDRQIELERMAAIKEGREEGREQGLTEGREQGLTEGREQGLTEGREQGLSEGKINAICMLVNKGKLTIADGAEELGISMDEMSAILAKF